MKQRIFAARQPALMLELFAALAILAGCAATPSLPSTASGEPAPVQLGPPIELLRVATVREKVHALADHDGLVHVLIASTSLKQVADVSVDRRGVVSQRIVRDNVSPARVNGAFDAQGRLHALVDSEHMVLAGDSWQPAERTPWSVAGIKADRPLFAQGAADLVWTFQVDGSEVNAPRRVDLMGFGGPSGGIVWPWFTRGTRAVVVAQDGDRYGPWIVVDPGEKEDTRAVRFAVDEDGAVHLLYESARGGLGAEPSRSYVAIPKEMLMRPPDEGAAATPHTEGATQIKEVHGRALTRDAVIRTHGPEGAHLIAAPDHHISGVIACESPGVVHSVTYGEARDQWLGKGRSVRYSAFRDDRWSAPIEVGVADVSSFLGWVWESLALACTDSGAALVVWPTEQALMGRWIQPLP